MEHAVLTGLGLAGPAGLNAYIPLLALGLNEGWSWPVLAALTVLLAVEVVVDKIAGADHVNDAVQTFVRPAAGAALMLLTTDDELSQLGDVLLGGTLAGSVHAVKAAARGVVTVSTFGIGNPVVSAIEDAFAAIASLVAIALPVLVLLMLPALFGLLAWVLVRRRRVAEPPG